MVKNGNFTLLLVMAISHFSTGQEWQFHINTDIYFNFTLLLTSMAISHWSDKNGNFTLLLIQTSSGHK